MARDSRNTFLHHYMMSILVGKPAGVRIPFRSISFLAFFALNFHVWICRELLAFFSVGELSNRKKTLELFTILYDGIKNLIGRRGR